MNISLASLSDDELHVAVRRLTARSNVTLADLLAHLGEVEERGIHRVRACATLHAYCQYELRMSEDAAFRRAKAARLVHQHPELRGIVARGELHLTGLLMIAPYLGGPRHNEVLERSRFRSKKEIARLIAEIDPKPEVPARIEPVAPAAPRRMPMHAIAKAFVGPVRSLPEGDRPADWIEPPRCADTATAGALADPELARDLAAPELARDLADPGQARDLAEAEQARDLAEAEQARDLADAEQAREVAEAEQARELAEAEAALERAWLAKQQARPERPLRFRVQFTAEQEYVDLLEEAFDLLGLKQRAASLPELQLRALREFVERLRRRRTGTKRGVRAPAAASGVTRLPAPTGPDAAPAAASGVTRLPAPTGPDAAPARRHVSAPNPAPEIELGDANSLPDRHLTATNTAPLPDGAAPPAPARDIGAPNPAPETELGDANSLPDRHLTALNTWPQPDGASAHAPARVIGALNPAPETELGDANRQLERHVAALNTAPARDIALNHAREMQLGDASSLPDRHLTAPNTAPARALALNHAPETELGDANRQLERHVAALNTWPQPDGASQRPAAPARDIGAPNPAPETELGDASSQPDPHLTAPNTAPARALALNHAPETELGDANRQLERHVAALNTWPQPDGASQRPAAPARDIGAPNPAPETELGDANSLPDRHLTALNTAPQPDGASPHAPARDIALNHAREMQLGDANSQLDRHLTALNTAPARDIGAPNPAPETELGVASSQPDRHLTALNTAPQPDGASPHAPAPARRRVSAAVRREVWARDEGRCAYTDDRGRRCAETRRLELHHRQAHALGGSDTAANLELRCGPHNLLAAEQDFGRTHMDRRRGKAPPRRASGTIEQARQSRLPRPEALKP